MGPVGLLFFFRPAWVARKQASAKKLNEIRLTGLILWGSLAFREVMRLAAPRGIHHASAASILGGEFAIVFAIIGLVFIIAPEKYPGRRLKLTTREVRGFGIFMCLWSALYVMAYL